MNTINTGRQDINLGLNEDPRKNQSFKYNGPVDEMSVENISAPSVIPAIVPQESVKPPSQIPKKSDVAPSSGQPPSSLRKRMNNDPISSKKAPANLNLPSSVKSTSSGKNWNGEQRKTPTSTKISKGSFKNAAMKSVKDVASKAAEPLTGYAPLTFKSALFLLLLASAAIGAVIVAEKVVVGTVHAVYDTVALITSFANNLVWGTAHLAASGTARATEKLVTTPVHFAENIAKETVHAAENVAAGTVHSASRAAENVVKGTARAAENIVKGTTQTVENAAKGAANLAENVVKGSARFAGDAVKGAARSTKSAIKETARMAENAAA